MAGQGKRLVRFSYHQEVRYGQAAMNRPECGVERTLAVIGGKWTTLILRELLGGTRRFSELRRALGRVSSKTLTERLRHLEAEALLTRTVYPEVPPRVEYTLTARGESLGAIITAMAHWGSDEIIRGVVPSPPSGEAVTPGLTPSAAGVTEAPESI